MHCGFGHILWMRGTAVCTYVRVCTCVCVCGQEIIAYCLLAILSSNLESKLSSGVAGFPVELKFGFRVWFCLIN